MKSLVRCTLLLLIAVQCTSGKDQERLEHQKLIMMEGDYDWKYSSIRHSGYTAYETFDETEDLYGLRLNESTLTFYLNGIPIGEYDIVERMEHQGEELFLYSIDDHRGSISFPSDSAIRVDAIPNQFADNVYIKQKTSNSINFSHTTNEYLLPCPCCSHAKSLEGTWEARVLEIMHIGSWPSSGFDTIRVDTFLFEVDRTWDNLNFIEDSLTCNFDILPFFEETVQLDDEHQNLLPKVYDAQYFNTDSTFLIYQYTFPNGPEAGGYRSYDVTAHKL